MPELQLLADDILIDNERKNKKNQIGYDEVEYNLFLKNRHKVDPKYLGKDIIYNFNQQGYRTKDIHDLEKEFVLVFGCSHTEGIGNFEEDIWCSQLLNKKGIDFLNLGKAASGPDVQYLNTVQWIKNSLPLPTLVIYQWPQTFRKSFCYSENNNLVLKQNNLFFEHEKLDSNWYLKRYCIEEGEMCLNNYRDFETCNLLWDKQNVPVINWSWQGDFEKEYKNLQIIETEDTGRARDLMHDGPDIHRQVAEQLNPIIDKLL